MKCQCKKSLNAPTESGVLLRYNGKCRAWANNLYASPDAVEKLIVEFVQRYEKFSDKQKLEFKTKNGLL